MTVGCVVCSVLLCSAQLCNLCCCAMCNCANVQPVLWLCKKKEKRKKVLSYDYQSIMQWNRLKNIYNLNWINSRLLILIFGKIEKGRRLPLICPRPTLPFFNFEFTVNWSKSIKKDFKLDCIYRKRSKIKMKKGKVRI